MMPYLLFTLIVLFAGAGAGGEIYFNRKKVGTPYELWKRYNKYATWCKVLGTVFALATGFIGGQLFLK